MYKKHIQSIFTNDDFSTAACSPVVRNYLKQSPLKHLKLSNLPGLTDIQKRALADEFCVRNLLCDYAYFGQFSPEVRSSATAVSFLDDDDGFGAMERAVRLLAGALGLGIPGAVVRFLVVIF
jgi:hypothetical protein